MKLVVRKWMEEDAEVIYRILSETWHDAYADFIPREDLASYLAEHYSPAKLKEAMRPPAPLEHTRQTDSVGLVVRAGPPEVSGFVAEADGAAAATMRLKFSPEEQRLYMQQLYVLPAFQGSGVGKQLLLKAVQEAKRRGLRQLWFGVMEKNEQALAWYRKYGFTVEKKEPFMMGATAVNHFIGYIPLAAFDAQ
ncbi:MAG: GNAT family N-acetyltransferase [Ignavibacteriales bacterium]|nr:GNAT family N-acetyltransferase [Ignavibacteriales bacterium]